MKKTAKLTIETQRVIVIRRLTESRRVMCEACDEVVSFVTADEAAALARLSARAIYRLIEARKLHFLVQNQPTYFERCERCSHP